MKKFISALAIVLCLLTPAIIMVGCGNNNNASNVKNRAYYVSVAKKDNADLSEYIDSNLRINFYDNNLFKLEIGEEDKEGYGSFSGSYKTLLEKLTLEITDYKGIYSKESTDEIVLNITPLKYEEGVLKTTFILNGDIYHFEFATK